MRDAGDKSYRAGMTIATLALMIAPAVLTAQSPTNSTTTADVSIADKVTWLARNAVTVRSIDPHDQDFADLRPLAKSIGDARIALLGPSREAAAVNAKDRLVRFLHQEMGFDILVADTSLFDAEELDRAMDRGAAAPEDLQNAIALTFASRGPMETTQPDILDYARATHKTGQPLHIAGFRSYVSTFMGADCAGQLFQFVDRIDPHLALPADRKSIQSLLILSSPVPRAVPVGPRQWDKVLPSALEAIARLDDGLGRLPPNSPDAPEISFYRYTLANLSHWALLQARRPLPTPRLDPLVWMAKVWRPKSKIVVWSSYVTPMRNEPVCREFGAAVYTIGLSEIKDDNGELQILAAGTQPPSAPVDGSLESLLHAVRKPYSFVDFRSLPQDHWLTQPPAARFVLIPGGISSWRLNYDGLLCIDLAMLKGKKNDGAERTTTAFASAPVAERETAPVSIADKVAWLARNAVTVRSIDPHDQDFADLRPLAKSIGDARVVLLGGSREAAAVDAKDRLVRFLHQEMGFDILVSGANLIDAEEFDRAMDRGASPAPALQNAIAFTFAIQRPFNPPGSQAPGAWPPAGWPPDLGWPWDAPTVIRGIQMGNYGSGVSPMQIAQPDILNYARDTHKTGRPLHIAGFRDGVAGTAAGGYAGQLLQFVNRVDPHLALPTDRTMIQSLLILYNLPRSNRLWSQPENFWKYAQTVIMRLCDGLGRLSPNSPDAWEASFNRHILANLGYWTFRVVGRPFQIEHLDSLTWIAKVWRPERKIVVWSSNEAAMRSAPVCAEFGDAAYTIALSEIKDDNGVLEVLAAGPQPSLAPVEGDLESLLHAAGKPYSFVDFRSLPQDHWLRQPLAAKLIPAPAISSWPTRYDGLLCINLAVLKDNKKK
jgi:erythromycin esterase-like protein